MNLYINFFMDRPNYQIDFEFQSLFFLYRYIARGPSCNTGKFIVRDCMVTCDSKPCKLNQLCISFTLSCMQQISGHIKINSYAK